MTVPPDGTEREPIESIREPRTMRLNRGPIAQLRADAGWASATDFAEAIKRSRSYVLQIEEGRALPSVTLVRTIAELIGVTPEDYWAAVKEVRRQLLEHELRVLDAIP